MLMFTVVQGLTSLLEAIHKGEICKGNYEDKYTSLLTIRDGVLMNHSSELS